MLQLPVMSSKRRSWRVILAEDDGVRFTVEQVASAVPAPDGLRGSFQVISFNLTGLSFRAPAAAAQGGLVGVDIEGSLAVRDKQVRLRCTVRRVVEGAGEVGAEFVDMTQPSVISAAIRQFMSPSRFEGVFRRMDVDDTAGVAWFRGAQDFDVLWGKEQGQVTVYLGDRCVDLVSRGVTTGRRRTEERGVLDWFRAERTRWLPDAEPDRALCKRVALAIAGARGLPAPVVAAIRGGLEVLA